MVGEKQYLLDRRGHANLVKPLGSKDAPNGEPKKDGRGLGALYTLGKSEARPCFAQADSAAEGTAQGPFWSAEIMCERAAIALQEEPLHRNDPLLRLDPRQERWPKLHIPAAAQWRSWMPAQRLRAGIDAPRAQIDVARRVGESVAAVPERLGKLARPWRDRARHVKGRGPFHGHAQVKAPDRPQDIERVASCKAFEQEAAVADTDREAWDPVVMRGAVTHRAVRLPLAAKPMDEPRRCEAKRTDSHGKAPAKIYMQAAHPSPQTASIKY
jgi:hypothetical protein